MIKNNSVYNNRRGIQLNNITFSTCINNLSAFNSDDGIEVNNNAQNIEVRNNTAFKNGHSGILFNGVTTFSCRNNISISNTQRGIYFQGTGNTGTYEYNNSYENDGNEYQIDGGTVSGNSNMQTNAFFINQIIGHNNFLRLMSTAEGYGECSPCINAGDPVDDYSLEPAANGNRINIGAYGNTIKAARTCLVPGNANIILNKSVLNITYNNQVSSVIPGATITYQIDYTNTGPVDAVNVIVYDKISINTVFQTNIISAPAVWQVQFASITNPDQSYNSTDYSNIELLNKSDVKWIKWIKDPVPLNEKGTFIYKVIIK
jgi:uncharacterized repeat protein (TIGR01451 family)